MKLLRVFENLLKKNLNQLSIHHLNILRSKFSYEFEIKYINRFVDNSKNAVDIGANRGIYTYYLSKLVPHVYAYEPNPELADYLRKTVHKNVSVHEIALSNKGGEGFFEIPTVKGYETPGLGRLTSNQESDFRTFRVKLKKLDDEVLDNIGFIKIDVEGHEVAVIEGGVNLINRNHPNMQIEIEQRHHSEPIFEIFDLIIEFGYTGYFVNNNKFVNIELFSYEEYHHLLK